MENPHFSKATPEAPMGNELFIPANEPSATSPPVDKIVLESTKASNLGYDYIKEGNFPMAEKMFRQALRGFEMKNGPHHQSTLSTMNTLGNLYADKGDFSNAERMYRRTLDIKEKLLGPDNEATLTSILNLGTLFSEHGKIEEAEHLFRRALDGFEKNLGPCHMSTISTLNNLANLYASQGRFEGVEEMYRRVLESSARMKSPSSDESSISTTVMNLGILYMKQGKLDEAEKSFQQALEEQESCLGRDHRSTLLTVANFGDLYRQMGELLKAEQAYRRALKGFEKALGYDSPITIMVAKSLALIHADHGDLDTPGRALLDSEAQLLDVTDTRIPKKEPDMADYEEGPESCYICDGIRKAALYTPTNLPYPVDMASLMQTAKNGCPSSRFFEAILRLRCPHAFENENAELYISWMRSRPSASSGPSKIIFWVGKGENEFSEGADCDIFEIFTLSGKIINYMIKIPCFFAGVKILHVFHICLA